MIKVLFVCTGNSCRSQMAEGLLRHFGGDKFEAFSAGLLATFVNPGAIEAMLEIGIDIASQTSKSVGEVAGAEYDYVITVCDHAKATCPFIPGKHKCLHWSTEDPVGRGMEEFRKVRDKLRKDIEKFIASFDK